MITRLLIKRSLFCSLLTITHRFNVFFNIFLLCLSILYKDLLNSIKHKKNNYNVIKYQVSINSTYSIRTIYDYCRDSEVHKKTQKVK